MDAVKAKQLETALKGKEFLNYTIDCLVDNGKSAAVFKGVGNDGQFVAIKIFDSDLIERFGYEIQEKRIQQEIGLKNHSVNNLVKIIDGGKHAIGSETFYYIIMEFVSGVNLKKFIKQREYDANFVKDVVKTLYEVTEALITMGIAHRDIKPENIMVDSQGNIIVMDLGVLKLIAGQSFSDQYSKQFVGTLQYAPPEFLMREEEDSINGWRAVNLYQIGAVLHDLITKKELFFGVEPYPKLVIAIKDEPVQITSTAFQHSFTQLALDLLTKNWKQRLNACPSQRLQKFYHSIDEDQDALAKTLEGIFSSASNNRYRAEQIQTMEKSLAEKRQTSKNLSDNLERFIDTCITTLQSNKLITKFEKSPLFRLQSSKVRNSNTQLAVKNILYKLEGEITIGFIRPIYLLVRIENDETSFGTVELLALSLGPLGRVEMRNPADIFQQAFNDMAARGRLGNVYANNNFTVDTYEAFKGVIALNDTFKTTIVLEMVKLLNVALKDRQPEVEDHFAEQEKRLKSNQGMYMSVKEAPKTKVYNKV